MAAPSDAQWRAARRLAADGYLAATRQRWLSRVEVDADGCWIWTGSRNFHGYSVFYFRGRNMRAFHVFLLLFSPNTPVPYHFFRLCHKPLCVRPVCQTSIRPPSTYSTQPAYDPRARELHDGGMSMRAIARKLDLNVSQVRLMARREAWPPSRFKPSSAAELDAAMELWKAGATPQELEARFCVGASTARNWVRVWRRGGLLPLQAGAIGGRKAWVRRYRRQGMSAKAIARKMKLDLELVTEWIADLPWKGVDPQRVYQMMDDGASMREISRRLLVSYQTIRTVMSKRDATTN